MAKVKDTTEQLTWPRIIPAAKKYPAQAVNSDIILAETWNEKKHQMPNTEQSRENRKGRAR